jgi:hypothetical protein
MAGKFARDQAFVTRCAEPDADIVALGYQIDHMIGKGDPHIHLRITRDEFRDDRHDLRHPKAMGHIDAQQAAGLGLGAADAGFDGIDFGEDHADLVEIGAALGGQADPPRGSLQEPGAQPVLQPPDQLAHTRRRQVQAFGRRGEAAGFGYRNEDLHLLQPAHPALQIDELQSSNPAISIY